MPPKLHRNETAAPALVRTREVFVFAVTVGWVMLIAADVDGAV
ncbi:hypothetical protein NB311A_21196 [Nitrobacter sp. Nb-311A]|nr:hypothetical protein NB311A_21196 [Nitrobacter sp. Nb-311A]